MNSTGGLLNVLFRQELQLPPQEILLCLDLYLRFLLSVREGRLRLSQCSSSQLQFPLLRFTLLEHKEFTHEFSSVL